jgi:hypothetical protein
MLIYIYICIYIYISENWGVMVSEKCVDHWRIGRGVRGRAWTIRCIGKSTCIPSRPAPPVHPAPPPRAGEFWGGVGSEPRTADHLYRTGEPRTAGRSNINRSRSPAPELPNGPGHDAGFRPGSGTPHWAREAGCVVRSMGLDRAWQTSTG